VSDEVVELSALAYEAGAEPARWPVFLERMSSALRGPTSAFQLQDVQHQSGSIAFLIGQDPAIADAYSTHYAALNPWTAGGAAMMQPGRILVGELVISLSALRRTEFYADFLRPQDLAHTLSAVVARDAENVAFVTVLRSSRHGAYAADEQALLARLVPHLRRAFEIHRRLGAMRRRDEALSDTVDRLPWAVMVLDRRRRVVFANAASRRIDRATMMRVLARARAGGGVVARESGRPLGVSVAPLVADDPLVPGGGEMQLVFVVDPDARQSSPLAWLREAYALTAAEARLCMALAGGASLEDVANSTSVAIGTLRTHLKHALAKTGTRRQSELVRVVLLGAPVFDPDP
jgi:DNA-binding CsgD family transcriptional regulator